MLKRWRALKMGVASLTIPHRLSPTVGHPPSYSTGFGLHFNDGMKDHQNEDHSPNPGHRTHNPPHPIPNRPLRGQRPSSSSFLDSDNNDKSTPPLPPTPTRSSGRGPTPLRPPSPHPSTRDSTSPPENIDEDVDAISSLTSRISRNGDGVDSASDEDAFLDKFKLRSHSSSRPSATTTATADATGSSTADAKAKEDTEPADPPQDAQEIFRKMKETGLIPNAVAMLDGLCKDGLVQDAMKLFALMRQKGTIPDVVVYTAVVEGFLKAQNPDDAIRIFRKMESSGVTPNTFTYTLLIQGLCKCARLNDAVDFSLQMLEAGHSPNVVTFVGLADALCREKGLQETQAVIATLRQKGFHLNDKAVRDFLDKNSPFSSSTVWEAIFGQKRYHKKL